jgi:four helix bundle protein
MFAHKKLSMWQESMQLVVDLYHTTSTFPKSELFSLTNQVRRSAASIPANISEGAARGKPKEFIRYLRIFHGSLSELDTHIDLAYRLNYLDGDTFLNINIKMKKISAQISGLIRSLEQKIKNQSVGF